MYIENNKIAFQQLFAGEDIYLLKNEFILEGQDTHEKKKAIHYYQPKQKVVILVNQLNPTDSELLGKILGAVKLDLQLVDVIELDKNKEVNLSQILTQKSVNQLVTFGINLSNVSLDVKLTPYQILQNQGIKFIYSDSLTSIQNDIPKKKALWVALKEMFI